MKEESSNSFRLAKITSTILHPYILLIPVITLVVILSVESPLEKVAWTLFTLVPVYALSAGYTKYRAIKTSTETGQVKMSADLVRNSPQHLLILTVIIALPAGLILYFFNGPENVLQIMLSLGLTMMIISLVNVFHRTSLHLSMVTSMFTSLALLYGGIVFITVPLIVVLGVARFRLKAHTPMEMITGFFIGLIATLAVSYFWNM